MRHTGYERHIGYIVHKHNIETDRYQTPTGRSYARQYPFQCDANERSRVSRELKEDRTERKIQHNKKKGMRNGVANGFSM